jgi:hypothetical protein
VNRGTARTSEIEMRENEEIRRCARVIEAGPRAVSPADWFLKMNIRQKRLLFRSSIECGLHTLHENWLTWPATSSLILLSIKIDTG